MALGNKEPVVPSEYVLTASVKANLRDLSRVVSARYRHCLNLTPGLVDRGSVNRRNRRI